MESIVQSFEELHQVLQNFTTSTIFRGVLSADYKLIPSVGRMQFITGKPVNNEEQLMFRKFQQRAIPYLEFTPQDVWDWLTLAQHHGLPTRLLDWSLNPLVATYFAVEDEDAKTDSAVYAIRSIPEVDRNVCADPFSVMDLVKYTPRHITRRLIAQAGLFTIHADPTEPHQDSSVHRIIIKQDARRTLRKTLYWYGIHRAALFPDLDGLCSHVKWLREDYGAAPGEQLQP